MRLEQALWRLEALTADADGAAVGKCVALDEDCGFLSKLVIELEVVGHVTELFFHLTDGLEVGSTVKGVATAEEETNQLSGDVAAGDVEASNEVVEDYGFVDGDNVGYTIS